MAKDLIADIGGTNLRFAEVENGQITRSAGYNWPDPPSISAVAQAFMQGATPRGVAIALAAPVTGDDGLAMPNRLHNGQPWGFSQAKLKQELGCADLMILNDFTAVAAALPHLTPADYEQIGGGTPSATAPKGVLGAGTGLGVSGVVPFGSQFFPLTAEGGHVTMAASNDREEVVLRQLRKTFGHVSAERVLSGMGLQNLYTALCQVDGHPVESLSPADVTTRGQAGDPVCAEALGMFCAMMGTAASDVALTLGARGGVYIAGGIVPRILETFRKSAFRDRFCDKGRYRDYMNDIPTYVVTHPNPAYVGLIGQLKQHYA